MRIVPLSDRSMMKTLQSVDCETLTNNQVIGLFQKELMNAEFT